MRPRLGIQLGQYPVSRIPLSRLYPFIPYPVSHYPVSRIPYPVSHIPYPVSHILYPISRIPYPVSRIPLSRIPYPIIPLSCIHIPISRIPYPIILIPFDARVARGDYFRQKMGFMGLGLILCIAYPCIPYPVSLVGGAVQGTCRVPHPKGVLSQTPLGYCHRPP